MTLPTSDFTESQSGVPEEIGDFSSQATSTFLNSDRLVVPVIEEELRVGKRVVESERLTIHKTVQEHDETVDLPLRRERLIVETIPVNREVEGSHPTVRQEGDMMIVPVLRETLVVKKVLMLVEELHIRREIETFNEPQIVTLRRETAELIRDDPRPESLQAQSDDLRSNIKE